MSTSAPTTDESTAPTPATRVIVLGCCCSYEPPGTRCFACLGRAHGSCHEPLIQRVPVES